MTLPPLSVSTAAARGLRLAAALLASAAALAALPAGAQPAPPAPPGAMPAHAMHHRAGPGMPGLSERQLDAVGASAEQKAQVRKIMDAAREDLRQQHESQRELHQQMVALMAAPQLDAAAAEALRQKSVAGHDAASKRMLQAMLDAGAVLTPEQRQKLGERMKQRQERMDQPRERRGPEPRG